MNLGGTQTFNHSRLSPSLSQCPYLLFYREKRRHMAETTSNSYHQNENISCMWCCHFFLPLQHKMGAFLYLLKTDLTLHPWRPPGQKSHNLLSSSPVLKFTLLLAPSQEHLNLLISCLLKKHQKPKTQTKKTQNNSPLDLVFPFRGLLLFCPISRQPSLIAVYIYCLLFLTPPTIAHRISHQLQWNCSLNSWNDIRSPTGIFRLYLSFFWAFNILEHLTFSKIHFLWLLWCPHPLLIILPFRSRIPSCLC